MPPLETTPSNLMFMCMYLCICDPEKLFDYQAMSKSFLSMRPHDSYAWNNTELATQ